MPGNKAVFQDAIKKGHNAAWDGQWAKAVAEYRRAVDEFPQDATVHLSMAHALEESGQYEDALHACRIAAKLQPHDPQPLLRVAKLQERLVLHTEAAGTYLQVAELYLVQKAVGKAAEAWQKAATLEPDRTDIHQRLAQVYEQGGHVSMAAKEHLAIARAFQRRGDKTKALEAARQAVALDAHNAAAKSLIDELSRGAPASQPTAQAGPVNQAQKAALARLAETLLDEPSAWPKAEGAAASKGAGAPVLSDTAANALIARAVDAQSQRRVGDAIEAYRQLLAAGVARPEVKFNLGLLYLETMRYDEAVRLLGETVGDPAYALASHYALGQCYRAIGNADAAVEHFLAVTRIVDLGSVRRDQADELISVYEGLAESYVAKGDRDQAESFSRSLQEFLSSKGWEDKVRDVRHHLELLREEGGQVSLAEIINLPDSDKVLESLALAQEYLRRGKLQAAGEECFRAIELAPSYLPGHVRLAEVLVKEGRTEEAHSKYLTLAELSAARGDLPRAEGHFRQALKLSPDDVTERSRLIDLLNKQGRPDAALAEYLELANGYLRSGHPDKAAAKLQEALRLASAAGNSSATMMSMRHRLAEIQARQGDVQAALASYQEIRKRSPDDERAHVYSVDLLFRRGDSAGALRDLQDLINRYRSRNEPRKAIAVLEGLVQGHPNEMTLRTWLAQLHLSTGNRDQAIATLDALGELQLSAGQNDAAAETIRQIIAMNPPRVEDYKQLLQQIAG